MHYQRILKHGNSLAIVIPAAVCHELDIRRGDSIKLRLLDGNYKNGGPKVFYLEISPVIEEGDQLR